MHYCQTEHYADLLEQAYGLKSRVMGGIRLHRRRGVWFPDLRGWEAIGAPYVAAVELMGRVRGRAIGCTDPSSDGALGALDPHRTWVVDLPHPKPRPITAALNRAERDGIGVRMVEDFSDWHHSAGHLWSWEFPPQGEDGEIFWQYCMGHWAHFVAEDLAAPRENRILATLGMYWWDGEATEVMSRIAPRARGRNVQEPLHVAAMDYAFSIGCTTFNLGGAATDGIAQFKRKFGGREVWVANVKL